MEVEPKGDTFEDEANGSQLAFARFVALEGRANLAFGRVVSWVLGSADCAMSSSWSCRAA